MSRNKINEFKQWADNICKIHGHIMGEWIAPNRDGRLISICQKCGKKAIIDLCIDDDVIFRVSATECYSKEELDELVDKLCALDYGYPILAEDIEIILNKIENNTTEDNTK